MPRICWPHVNERPVVHFDLIQSFAGTFMTRIALADTGAGPRNSPIELVLSDPDCQRFGLRRATTVGIGGAITGTFPIYEVQVSIPALGFSSIVLAAAVSPVQLPHGLDGIACFRFLNRFTYGNFGDLNQFGLETP